MWVDEPSSSFKRKDETEVRESLSSEIRDWRLQRTFGLHTHTHTFFTRSTAKIQNKLLISAALHCFIWWTVSKLTPKWHLIDIIMKLLNMSQSKENKEELKKINTFSNERWSMFNTGLKLGECILFFHCVFKLGWNLADCGTDLHLCCCSLEYSAEPPLSSLDLNCQVNLQR